MRKTTLCSECVRTILCKSSEFFGTFQISTHPQSALWIDLGVFFFCSILSIYRFLRHPWDIKPCVLLAKNGNAPKLSKNVVIPRKRVTSCDSIMDPYLGAEWFTKTCGTAVNSLGWFHEWFTWCGSEQIMKLRFISC